MMGEEYILSMSYELDSVLGNLLTWFFFSQLYGVTSYPIQPMRPLRLNEALKL